MCFKAVRLSLVPIHPVLDLHRTFLSGQRLLFDRLDLAKHRLPSLMGILANGRLAKVSSNEYVILCFPDVHRASFCHTHHPCIKITIPLQGMSQGVSAREKLSEFNLSVEIHHVGPKLVVGQREHRHAQGSIGQLVDQVQTPRSPTRQKADLTN